MSGTADRGTGLWPALAWAEGFLLVGLVFVGLAIASTLPSCDSLLSGCAPAPSERSLGGDSIVLLVTAGAALAAGIFMASWTSGWSGPRVLLQATIALVASAAALPVGAIASRGLVDEYLPALVLAVGVAGTVAIRPSSPQAVTARLVILAIFMVFAVGVANVAGLVVLLALLTLPAMGAAESAVGSTDLDRDG